jgi:hypothetical protein
MVFVMHPRTVSVASDSGGCDDAELPTAPDAPGLDFRIVLVIVVVSVVVLVMVVSVQSSRSSRWIKGASKFIA